ncbi:MAG: hypothetical protein Q8891_11430 [Bacteroidota bacterium]|nr:hypothetical protein [Bacteroidota bacterium]
MKQAIKTTRMITIGLFTLFTMGLTQTSFAGIKSDNPVELKFIGKIKSQPVFQLDLNNKEAGEYYISIKDHDKNVLYSENVKGINLSRKYQLAIDEADLKSPDFGVSIEVTSAKTHSTQVYQISSSIKTIENIVVAKL